MYRQMAKSIIKSAKPKHVPASAADKVSRDKKSIGHEALVNRMASMRRVFGSYTEVSEGVSSRYVRDLEPLGITRDDIRQIVPDRTLDRRIAAGDLLRIDEADGIARLLRVVTMARETFEDAGLADSWLRSPNPALGDNIPIRMARTDLGGREVEAALGRLASGVFS